jgi:beta-galactosidase/beta-glucuronidase
MPEPGYPRPQFRRKDWQCLNGVWKFAFDDEQRFTHPTDPIPWSHEIQVPYPPESHACGIGDQGFHLACWYEREFELVADGHRVLLHCGAIDYLARVWVNNRFVIAHEGGHTPFSAGITHLLKESGRQTATIYAGAVAKLIITICYLQLWYFSRSSDSTYGMVRTLYDSA